MLNSLPLGRPYQALKSELIGIINVLLCIYAIIAAFFSWSLAWGLLLLPVAYVLFTASAARASKLEHIAELSENANAMLRTWHHYYLHPTLCATCRAVGLAAPVVGIIGCFYGSCLGLGLGVGICLVTFKIAPVFNADDLLRNPIYRQAHEEVTAFISQKLEDAGAATSPHAPSESAAPDRQETECRGAERQAPKVNNPLKQSGGSLLTEKSSLTRRARASSSASLTT
jgi:hypothetical protein